MGSDAFIVWSRSELTGGVHCIHGACSGQEGHSGINFHLDPLAEGHPASEYDANELPEFRLIHSWVSRLRQTLPYVVLYVVWRAGSDAIGPPRARPRVPPLAEEAALPVASAFMPFPNGEFRASFDSVAYNAALVDIGAGPFVQFAGMANELASFNVVFLLHSSPPRVERIQKELEAAGIPVTFRETLASVCDVAVYFPEGDSSFVMLSKDGELINALIVSKD